MSYPTPSQAEGEPEDDPMNPADRPAPPHSTPSQAEGEREETPAPNDTQGLGA
ncbi:hypothetical protein GCM10027074_06420 [Streptomyces deserti]